MQIVRGDIGRTATAMPRLGPRKLTLLIMLWRIGSRLARFDEGEPISAEGNLLRAADLDGDWDAFELADEQTVMAVAAEWSINPTTLNERDDLPPHGLLGFLA